MLFAPYSDVPAVYMSLEELFGAFFLPKTLPVLTSQSCRSAVNCFKLYSASRNGFTIGALWENLGYE